MLALLVALVTASGYLVLFALDRTARGQHPGGGANERAPGGSHEHELPSRRGAGRSERPSDDSPHIRRHGVGISLHTGEMHGKSRGKAP